MSVISHDYSPDTTLAILGTLAYAEDARGEVETLSFETRCMLDSICRSVEHISEESHEDFADSLADLDAILDTRNL